jgi:hypothetical protein
MISFGASMFCPEAQGIPMNLMKDVRRVWRTFTASPVLLKIGGMRRNYWSNLTNIVTFPNSNLNPKPDDWGRRIYSAVEQLCNPRDRALVVRSGNRRRRNCSWTAPLLDRVAISPAGWMTIWFNWIGGVVMALNALSSAIMVVVQQRRETIAPSEPD